MIRRLRLKHGYTQEELGKKVGVSACAVKNWETKGFIPDVFHCIKLAKLFGITVEVLAAGLMESSDEKKDIKEHLDSVGLSDRQVRLSEVDASCHEEKDLLSCRLDVCLCCGCELYDCNQEVYEELVDELQYKYYNRGLDSLDRVEKLLLRGLCDDCYYELEFGEDY